MKRKTSRREFLTGRSAVEALGDLTHGTTLPDPSAAAGGTVGSPLLMQIGRRAMACQFEVILDARRDPDAAETALEVLDLVDELEDQLSVYRDHSEVCSINARARTEAVTVEPRLFALLQEAVELYEATAGAFDITAGPLARVWGFHRRQGQIPADADLAEALAVVGTDKLELDVQRSTIRFREEGMEINLGAIGKGYALDRGAERLLETGAADFLLHGGQSSVLARGSRYQNKKGGQARFSEDADDEPASDEPTPKEKGGLSPFFGWMVGVKHPMRPGQRLAEIWLNAAAMGTSGSRRQSFTYRGRRYGHILDPRTGRPADGVLSATVIAPTAAEADALSTAFYVMGVERSLAFCETRPELAALIVTPGRRSGGIELHTAGLSDDRWRRVDEAQRSS